jgi:nuclear pore complex protein Nup50
MMQFRNKRIMEGSLFDIHRAEPSQQLMGEAPQLDMKRAESSQQHVRALNTQFARFIFNLMSTNLLFLDLCISVF